MNRTPGQLAFAAALSCLLPAIALAQTAATENRGQVIGGATVSARLVSELFSRPVQQTTSIRENLMGAATNGTARTNARVLAEFLPHHEKAILNIRLRGTMVANNSSQRGRVTVYTGSQTSIDARKQISIRQGQLAAQDAVADCSTSMWIRDISANRRIIERFARRRVERMRSQIESTTSQRAAREIESQLNQEVAGLTGKMKSGTEGTLTEGALPLDIRFQTSRRRLFVSLLGRSKRQGANLGVAAADYDLGFSAHETLIEVAMKHLVAGKRVADERFLTIIETISGDAPRQLWVHTRKPRWSVLMADTPVDVSFDNNGFLVTLFFDELTIGEDRYQRPIMVSAAYRLEPTPNGPHLTRDTEVEITVGKEPDDGRQAIKPFLARKFSAFFQPDLYFDGMVPPVGGSGGRLRQLQMKRLSTHKGWLVMGYQLPNNKLADSKTATR